ncbi:MAG: ParA family protein [Caldilineaceae bacterium]|nr:ParA family protein [Caldilineaceae bacterium]
MMWDEDEVDVFTFTLNKGGVAKSTLAVNVAHKLALMDRRVLLFDADPQGSAATLLGFDPCDSSVKVLRMAAVGAVHPLRGRHEPTDRHELDDTAAGLSQEQATAVQNALIHTGRHGLDLLAGSAELRAFEREMLERRVRPRELAERLRPVFAPYDAVVIDTHPGYFLQELAILLATRIVLPVATEFLVLREVRETLAIVEALGCQATPRVVTPTLYRAGMNESEANYDLLRQSFAQQLTPVVPYSEAVKQCPSYGETLWESDQVRQSATGRAAQAAIEALVVQWLLPGVEEVLFGVGSGE